MKIIVWLTYVNKQSFNSDKKLRKKLISFNLGLKKKPPLVIYHTNLIFSLFVEYY